MSKVHPQLAPPSPTTSCSSSSPSCDDLSCSDTRENFTIWMKSLILGGKGCTVFDSKGQVVYRVDNYCSKYCDQVFLMDSHGRVLLTVLRKKFSLLAHFEGYREERKKGASSWWFQVRKSWKMTKSPFGCEIVVNLDHDNESSRLKIEKGKSELSSYRIVNKIGGVLAEMKQKQSLGGVFLGNDVLTMAVEPNIDHSLIMGIIVSYGLLNCRM